MNTTEGWRRVQLKVTVLGKYGPFAKQGQGATSSYLVEDNGTSLLLDMGAGTLSRLASVIDIKKIDGIFLSHLHFDHTSDLLTFRYLLECLEHTLTVYAYYEDSEWYRLLLTHPNFNVVNIDESSQIRLGKLNLRFFLMNHTVEDYAIRIEGSKVFVYTGDTVFTPNIYKAIEGADCLLADCSKPEGFDGPHMTVDKAIEIHKKSGIRILATHMSPDYSPEKDFADYDSIQAVEEMAVYEI
jgi:ribonuclease BN (tRNA processing enzyme)